MVHLFLGDNAAQKDQKINQIKEKHLTSKDARHFDLDVLYGNKLDADDLKKALLNLPAVAKERVVIIKEVEKLKKGHERIITEFLDGEQKTTVLILDSDRADLKSRFIKDIKRLADVTVAQQGVSQNVFDMTKAIERRQPVDALKVLNRLYEDGSHPLQILGALIWFWGRTKQRLNRKKFLKGLEFLQEADLNIKRSRLRPEYAIEKLVVSLSALLA